MEQVAAVVDRFCTFPAIERVKLLERTLFSFLTGNEDMHLKNFSLIDVSFVRFNGVVYRPGHFNARCVIANAQEHGFADSRQKVAADQERLLDYFAGERLHINARVLADIIERFRGAFKNGPA